MNSITVFELAGHQDQNVTQRIDVRSASEFAAGHVPGAINIPMDQVNARLADLSPNLPVLLICKSGMRAGMVSTMLRQCRQDVCVLDGGTDAWAKAGFPLVVSTKTGWALERQVRLAAGLFVLLGVALSLAVNSYWLYLSGFAGLGLTFAGLTDFCPMGILLSKMPWNGARQCQFPPTQRIREPNGRNATGESYLL